MYVCMHIYISVYMWVRVPYSKEDVETLRYATHEDGSRDEAREEEVVLCLTDGAVDDETDR